MEQNNQHNNFPSQPPQNGGGATEKKHLEWVLTNQNDLAIKIAKLELNHTHIAQSIDKIESLLNSNSEKLLLGQEKLSGVLNEQVKALIQETKQDVKGLGVEFKADLKGCDESLKKEIKDSNTEIKKINTKIAWALGALVGAIFIGGVVINGSLGKIFKIMEQSSTLESPSKVKKLTYNSPKSMALIREPR